MILPKLQEYHRPTGIDEAINLLRRDTPHTALLIGDLSSVSHIAGEVEAVVDVEDLGLALLEIGNNVINVGSMVTLQTLVETLDGIISKTAQRTLAWNERNSVTIGSLLVSRSWTTPLSVTLAALDATVILADSDSLDWADAITSPAIFPLSVSVPGNEVGTAYHQVGRTPADLPIVSVAVKVTIATDDTADVRLAVGGYRADGLLIATGSIHLGSGLSNDIEALVMGLADLDNPLDDHLGSHDYRAAMVPVLVRRAISDALRQVQGE